MPSEKIPTVAYTDLSRFADLSRTRKHTGYHIVESAATVHSIGMHFPYRSSYYAVGLCLRGEATLMANLQSYQLQPGALLMISPEVIRQWDYISPDHLNIGILFEKEYALMDGVISNFIGDFAFFRSGALHFSLLAPSRAERLKYCLEHIKESAAMDCAYRDEVIRHLIHAFLYTAAGFHEESVHSTHRRNSRQEVFFTEFQYLVHQHFKTERKILFYATKLHVTSKHLSETIKAVSGKTARQWINETVVLEAKVLLQNLQLTVGQIAESLNYPDQSSFGKFFKGQTGQSPSAFRQAI